MVKFLFYLNAFVLGGISAQTSFNDPIYWSALAICSIFYCILSDRLVAVK